MEANARDGLRDHWNAKFSACLPDSLHKLKILVITSVPMHHSEDIADLSNASVNQSVGENRRFVFKFPDLRPPQISPPNVKSEQPGKVETPLQPLMDVHCGQELLVRRQLLEDDLDVRGPIGVTLP